MAVEYSEWLSKIVGLNMALIVKSTRDEFVQSVVFFTLAIMFVVLSLAALVQLIRILWRSQDIQWTIQKVFLFMNFIVHGVRAIVFEFNRRAFRLSPKVLVFMLMDLPGLMFFSTYTLLVLYWARTYYQANNKPVDNLKRVYLYLNSGIYFIQVCIWYFLWLDDTKLAEAVCRLYIAVVSLVASAGFMFYGEWLVLTLKELPIESRGRTKKLYEVGSIGAICCVAFLIRFAMVTILTFSRNASLDVPDHPKLNFLYYMLVEIIPSALVLFILRKLPPKRRESTLN